MNDDALLLLAAALFLAADRVGGATWEASGDGHPREYEYDTPGDAVAKARDLLAEVRKAA